MITQHILIPDATAQQLYDVLMQSDLHKKLIGGEVVIQDVVGAAFSTFGGYAEGKNLELVPGERIKQTWRASDWPDGHYSTITFVLRDAEGGAMIDFTQDDLPDGSQAEFEAGWEDNYWQPLKRHFEEE